MAGDVFEHVVVEELKFARTQLKIELLEKKRLSLIPPRAELLRRRLCTSRGRRLVQLRHIL